MSKDTYNTLKEPSLGEYREKGSKFFAYAEAVYNEEQMKDFLFRVKKEHPKARHHCYAYRLGIDKTVHYRANDDGEPSGSAGLPILGQIDSKELSNIMVIVVRYFGGTKLGVPGLINAYKTSTRDAFNQAIIIEKKIKHFYTLVYPYEQMNKVMKILKKEQTKILRQAFDNQCQIDITIRTSQSEALINQLEKINHLEVRFLYTR